MTAANKDFFEALSMLVHERGGHRPRHRPI